MIHEVEGDILLTHADVIAHGVAPDDHFDQGLALALRSRWPSMAKDFRHWCRIQHPKPGSIWAWPRPDGKRIVNLLTQDPAPTNTSHPRPAKLKYVNKSLKALGKWAKKEGVETLALPKLATGVGGLEWDDVEALIRKHLAKAEVEVFVYSVYHPGEEADEHLD